MSRLFDVHQPLERAYVRRSSFAVELIDAVTLLRVSNGVKVTANGLTGKPFVNSGGLFVWREETLDALQTIAIDPGALPYERVVLARADLRLPPAPRPLTTVQLAPRLDYPFAAGTTAARGVLVEDHADRVPVADAEVRLRWLDDDGATWHDAPMASHTSDRGDFVSLLRLSPVDVPAIDVDGRLTVRLRVARASGATRTSNDFPLPQGRVADPTTSNALVVAWDELQP